MLGVVVGAQARDEIVATLDGIRNDRSQIQRVNLQTGQLTPISPEGRFAEYQGASISPTGRYISYLHGLGPNRREFVLDGKPVYTTDSYPRGHWIDENTIAIVDLDNVLVVRAPDQTVVTRFAFPSQ